MWSWLKRWSTLILGVLLMLVGVGWLWQRRKRLDAESRAKAARLNENISVAAAVRNRLLLEVDASEPQVRKLDEEIHSNERALLRLHDEDPTEMSVDEIRERLANLGY
jgi:hypothetical protein